MTDKVAIALGFGIPNSWSVRDIPRCEAEAHSIRSCIRIVVTFLLGWNSYFVIF